MEKCSKKTMFQQINKPEVMFCLLIIFTYRSKFQSIITANANSSREIYAQILSKQNTLKIQMMQLVRKLGTD